MNKIISVASGFQYSVNIGYDLNQDDKLQNFIPTKSSLNLLKKDARQVAIRMAVGSIPLAPRVDGLTARM